MSFDVDDELREKNAGTPGEELFDEKDVEDTAPLREKESPETEKKPVAKIKNTDKKQRAKTAKPARARKKATKKKKDKLLGADEAPYLRERTSPVGDVFYYLGFYAEYFMLHIGKGLKTGGLAFAQIFMWLFGGFFSKLFGFIRSLAEDLASPFVRFARRRQEQYAMLQKERRSGSGKKGGGRRFGYGVKNTASLFANIAKMLLPVVSAVALVYTVYTMFSWNYVLAVEVEGEVIGYVADESVLEDAQNILRMKIQLAPNQTLSEWDFEPTLTLGTSEEVANKTQIADEILRSSSNEIMEANGVYVDGVLVGVTTEGAQVRALLEEMRSRYEDPAHPEAVVDFVRDVEVSEDGGVFFTESVQPYEELMSLLTRVEESERRHTVAAGETLEDIAYAGGITLEQLRLRNPEYEEVLDTYRPEEGTSILLEREKPYLQVQTTFREVEEEEIPYEVEEVTDSNLRVGMRVVTTPGEEGLQEVSYDLTYIDGEMVQKLRLDELTQVIREPVTQVVQVGTQLAIDGSAVIPGSSGYAWPVPDASYSSRGFLGAAHRGVDINAPTGTSIYASNGGLVITAGWHWSYGNYVEIEHADGLHTLYAHCSALYVNAGDVVNQGSLIAAVGSTGVSTGSHCHFEIIVDGVRVDPAGFVSAPW